MKKIIFGIVSVIAIVSCANAVDVAEIKAVCEASDKTLWDDSNEYCLPANPCLDETGKYVQYCDWNTFKYVDAFQLNEWEPLVKIYARTHGLDCDPVRTDNDHFVWCVGKNVKVFYFSSVKQVDDEAMSENLENNNRYNLGAGKLLKRNICESALGGQYIEAKGEYADECKTSKSKCDIVKNVWSQGWFKGRGSVFINPGTNNCVIDVWFN